MDNVDILVYCSLLLGALGLSAGLWAIVRGFGVPSVHALHEAEENAKRRTREIETEWEDTYEKFHRMLGRLDKYAGRARGKEVGGSPPLPESEPAAPAGSLTAQQRRAKILAAYRQAKGA